MNVMGRVLSLRLLAVALHNPTVHSGMQRCLSSVSTSQSCRATLSMLPAFGSLGQTSGFLKPVSVVNTAATVAGLKHVANPRRRCKHCWAAIKVNHD